MRPAFIRKSETNYLTKKKLSVFHQRPVFVIHKQLEPIYCIANKVKIFFLDLVAIAKCTLVCIRDLINPLSMDFAGDDVVDATGFDGAMLPPDVLAAAQPYIKDTIIATNLPTL